jgi:hypothetical protein
MFNFKKKKYSEMDQSEQPKIDRIGCPYACWNPDLIKLK